MSRFTRLLVAFAATLLLVTAVACRPAETPPVPHVVVTAAEELPLDPFDPAWQAAPEHIARLLLQDMVEPRTLEITTEEVRVRSLSAGGRIAFRLQWNDRDPDDAPGQIRFADACAVQLPAEAGPTLPAPQMGEPGHAVEITYWSAKRQAALENPVESIADIYPHASVDHYPFEADSLEEGSPQQRAMALRYSPAHALGNPVSGPITSAVEDLIAAGPGTTTTSPTGGSEGRGERTDDGWAVVIVRTLPPGLAGNPAAQVALAVWDGSHGETGARKMRTGWIPMEWLP